MTDPPGGLRHAVPTDAGTTGCQDTGRRQGTRWTARRGGAVPLRGMRVLGSPPGPGSQRGFRFPRERRWMRGLRSLRGFRVVVWMSQGLGVLAGFYLLAAIPVALVVALVLLIVRN